MRALALAAAALLAAGSTAMAQSGWVRSIETPEAAKMAGLPPIKSPQPGWEAVSNIQESDGTAPTPSCGDPSVVATARDGILGVYKGQVPRSLTDGVAAVEKSFAMGPVWVHPAYSGRQVCDVRVQVFDPATVSPDNWKFETFASDGEVKVFFYDVDNQH